MPEPSSWNDKIITEFRANGGKVAARISNPKELRGHVHRLEQRCRAYTPLREVRSHGQAEEGADRRTDGDRRGT
jgi:hypothetical protein